MTKTEILEDTIKYYKTHKRGITADGSCVNLTNRGSMCAVGRCIEKELIGKLKNVEDIAVEGLTVELGMRTTDECLQAKYRGHSEEFWEDLQHLHDHNLHWLDNRSGGSHLTETGLKNVGLIEANIRDGLYD